jgi:hypothetical protein
MKLSELVQTQVQWEGDRGITNHNDNLIRTQDELNEAFEETEDLPRLMEMIDVCIVLAGGMGRIVERLGLYTTAVDELLATKIATNHRKYDLEIMQSNTSSQGQFMCRHYWSVDPSEWETDGDFY